MERKRFAYCLAVSAALILLFGRLDVYVPAAVKDPQRATLHKSLKNMACDETTVFIQDKFLSSTSGVTKRVKEEAARAKAGTCEQEKQFIFNFISKQLPDALDKTPFASSGAAVVTLDSPTPPSTHSVPDPGFCPSPKLERSKSVDLLS
ncbi:hypothetical protein AXG93_3661s1440 [Marchantia polymorpha subsp. ruderalis]|uniref:Uncharacterized protein n=1 Tax=Marchantia polymorpha subsp. ruderalis TaxID=1480154 RepID=A0A176VJJ4_MARPO|nr:hypothetical protein AXG93_3661s1440 [Marchantia polymorpha subsp. ruderalis]